MSTFCKEPVNPQASKEAKELLAYLCEHAGKKLITGQHTQTKPMEERAYIKEVTGKYQSSWSLRCFPTARTSTMRMPVKSV